MVLRYTAKAFLAIRRNETGRTGVAQRTHSLNTYGFLCEYMNILKNIQSVINQQEIAPEPVTEEIDEKTEEIEEKPEHPMQGFVDQYVEERGERNLEFIKIFLEVHDGPITSITEETVKTYRQAIRETMNTDFMTNQGLRSLNCFFRYWRARGHRYLMQIPTTWHY